MEEKDIGNFWDDRIDPRENHDWENNSDEDEGEDKDWEDPDIDSDGVLTDPDGTN